MPVLFAAAHRVNFLAGAVQAVIAIAVWGLLLGTRAGIVGMPLPPLLERLPPAWWHGLWMVFHLFAFFVCGFILTAGPRWQGLGDLPRRDFLPGWGFYLGGSLLAWPALWHPGLFAAAVGLQLSGWLWLTVVLTRVALSNNLDRLHIRLAATAFWLAAAGQASLFGFALGGGHHLARAALAFGLWGFLLPIFLIVVHRMLPFFSSAVIPSYVVVRPTWALGVLLAASSAHGLLGFLGLGHWLWLLDLPAAATAAWLSWHWRPRAAWRVPLLAVLHVAFLWCGIAFGLYAIQGLLQLVRPAALGLAPLHALGLGFCASMMIGMVSRVTLGHSGRGLPPADDALWRAFWLIQAAAVARVGGELMPGSVVLPSALLAAVLWLAAFVLWLPRYLPVYWQPRADGRPG